MMGTAPKHREAIVDAAVTLFRQKGYAATGLADIVYLSGAPKGSLYHYFPGGKASIGEAAVREAGLRVAQTVEGLLATSRSAGELVRAHAALLGQWMAQSDFRDGSPMTTVLLENAPQDAAITAAGQEAHAAWRAILRRRLMDDGFDRQRAESLAALAIALLDGALVQSRIQSSAAPLDSAAAMFAELLLQSSTGTP
jgi:TetR/AcrR family transcriptional repressor of lmrAB and yxaGH operons